MSELEWQDSGCRQDGLCPDVRNVRIARGQSRRKPVHPAPVSNDVRTRGRADTGNRRHLGSKGASPTLKNYNLLLSKDDNVYANLYRAQRIVYDCLDIEHGSDRKKRAADQHRRRQRQSSTASAPSVSTRKDVMPGSPINSASRTRRLRSSRRSPTRCASSGRRTAPSTTRRCTSAAAGIVKAGNRRVTSPPSRRRPGRTTRSPIRTA